MILKKIFYLLFFIFFSKNLVSQPAFEKLIQGSLYLEGNSIANTDENGIVIVGKNQYGALLVKIDSTGNIEWEKEFTNLFWGNATGLKVIQTKNHEFVITGWIGTGIDIAEIFFLKTDSLGNLLWYRLIKEFDIDWPTDLIESSSGNYYMTGYSYYMGGNGVGPDVILFKVDPDGHLLFAKAFGGLQSDKGIRVIELNNRLIVFASSASFASGSVMYIADTLGNIISSKAFDLFVAGRDFARTKDSAIVATGVIYDFPTHSNDSVFLTKLDSSGNQEWVRTFPFNSIISVELIKTLNNGDISMMVNASTIMLLDSTGNIKWVKSFNKVLTDYTINNKNEIVILRNEYNTSNGNNIIYIIKTDSLGNTNCNSGYSTSNSLRTAIPFLLVSPTETDIMHQFDTIPGSTVSLFDSTILTCPLGSDISENLIEENVKIYPNPFDSFVKINIKNNLRNNYFIQIYDQLGALVNVYNSTDENFKLNLDYIEDGVYFLKINSNNQIIIKKLLKMSN
jgi:hypothetical protein